MIKEANLYTRYYIPSSFLSMLYILTYSALLEGLRGLSYCYEHFPRKATKHI